MVWWISWMFLSFAYNAWVVTTALGWGLFGLIMAIFLFPIAITVAPFYAMIAWGNFGPIVITYGGAIVGFIVIAVSSKISGENTAIKSTSINNYVRKTPKAPRQGNVQCPKCQHINPASNVFCAGCGLHFSGQPEDSSTSRNANPLSVTRAHRVGISKDEPKPTRADSQNSNLLLRKRNLLEFLKKIEPQGFASASRALGNDFLNITPNQEQFITAGSRKNLFINAIAKMKNVDQTMVLSSFDLSDMSKALNAIPHGELSEIVATVHEIHGEPETLDLEEDEPQETAQPETLDLEASPLCLKCGHDNPVVAKHCISCGEKLPDLICPKCETENIPQAKFCMGCGEER